MIGLGKINPVPGLRSSIVRSFSSHYDALGVTPKSTQGEIKTAYYKLSKIYHPDKSTDETSAKKFRAITEAYEVLGNVKLKKMYDRGLLGVRGESRMTREPMTETEPTDPSLRFFKSRNRRHVVPTMDGKTPIYDFDAWAKNHYSTLYEKSQHEKDFLRKKQEKQADAVVSQRQESVMIGIIILTTLLFIVVAVDTSNYDQDRVSHNKSNEEPQDAKT